MSGHKISPVVLGLYNLSSVLFWLFLCVKKRGKEQVHWRQEAEGLPAVDLVLTGKQMMIPKYVPCLVSAFRTVWAPFHSFSNSIFRTLVLSDPHMSFKYQFVSDEIFCVYSLCGFP